MIKKGIINYMITGLCLTVFTGLLLFGLSKLSVRILNDFNDRYMALYMMGEKGVSSPWYLNGFHIVDEGFIDEMEEMKRCDRNVVSIGSSLSVVSFQPSIIDLDDDYEYRFMVCGNGCWKSDRQLYNLYKAAGDEHNDDIIKLEMSFSTFRTMDMSITESVVAKWRAYTVEPDGSVRPNTPVLYPITLMNLVLLRVQNLWELGTDCRIQLVERYRDKDPKMIIPGNFRNNYFNYDTVADSCKMTKKMKKDYLNLVETIAGEHHLVVEISPLPKGLSLTSYGKSLNKYIDKELIPSLEKRGIRYLDYRNDYAEDEFCDGVHLGYEAGVKYTKKLTTDMDEVIADVR